MPRKSTRKHIRQIGGLFTATDRLNKLTEFTTPLDKLGKSIRWEGFRKILQKLVPRKDRSAGGRPPFDHVFMLKVLVLQTYYGLSDERIEFEILDRYSFQKFLGVEREGRVPDRTSIWGFKEQLGEEGTAELFAQFDMALEEAGLLASKGKIVDASFVDAPRQRNKRDENERIKNGEGAPESWSENKKRQKDTDARWAKKNNETHFGYKNHVKINRKTKLIEVYSVSDASVHDSRLLDELLEESDGEIFGDSAYKSAKTDGDLRCRKIRNRIHEKGKRNAQLNEKQKRSNQSKSRIRARVEHVFGYMAGKMSGHRIRSIGMKRARRGIGFYNLVYNMVRIGQIGVRLA